MKKQKYIININDQKLTVIYQPEYIKNTIHFEFHGVEGEKNPISKTGYRSHFIIGTPKSCGITSKNIQSEIQKLGERLAEEETVLRLKEKRRRKFKVYNYEK